MGSRRRRRSNRALWWYTPLFVAVILGTAWPSGGAAVPILPPAVDSQFLTNLSAPPLAPGSSETIEFTLHNPLPTALTSVSLTFTLYAYNAFPGNATGPIPPTGAPSLSIGGVGSLSQSYLSATLSSGQNLIAAPLAFSAPGDAGQGTYAVRTSLNFQANGTSYRLASRGYFTEGQWENATTLPGGGSTLNLTRLNVSGILPETAVLVRSNDLSLPIYLILALGAAFAVAAGYVIARRGPGSKSGARGSPEDKSAPRALGKRRKRAGD